MATDLSAPLVRDAEPTPIRVASVPSSHVYVRHLSPPGDATDGVRRLPDPVPSGAAPQSRWWPPAMLEADWVHAHHDDFDVFHIHFGFDARTPQQLTDLVDALGAHGKPLVLTVHDLRNPHHAGREEHDAQLDVLVPAAQALITLTPGAAAQIRHRWGRRAQVIGHPHVVELDDMARWRAMRTRHVPFRIGLHVKSLRASMDPAAVLPALVRAADEIGDAVVQVDGHRDVLETAGARYDRRLADQVRSYGDRIDLRVHDYFDDQELWAYLASLDVSVLPYRFGTHSGWLEACRDLETQVIAPTCGYYAEQGPVHSYVMDEERWDEDSLVEAVHRAHRSRPSHVTVAERERQRYETALAHRTLYDTLLA
ncbi:glycosyltransferase family protein [Aeromicrobium wangtongii]|uniref:Glycosyltransferase n=1 Tax=Aeromicrobium wangtongii TaxID=2969247 RepID=A0ABY5M7X6_9ACTN|nr:glycosyltransferase [Aeromicrobium wangtongii]MCD9198723.1 glycosyltransferase [Aeromicrobium wangtongii]UUP13231.1 glycosyltransferase [Aeromicrobium wangtongii]